MKTTPKAMNSPLDRISNLRPVADRKLAELEQRMRGTYVARTADYLREARLRADKIRDKSLY